MYSTYRRHEVVSRSERMCIVELSAITMRNEMRAASSLSVDVGKCTTGIRRSALLREELDIDGIAEKEGRNCHCHNELYYST